jgi:hypothetical protein
MANHSPNLQLDRPRLLLTETRPLHKWLFYTVLLALGGLGAWGSFLTAFEIPASPGVLAVFGALSCGFVLWRQVDTRRRWWSVSLAGWIVWLLALVFLFEQCLHGAVRTVNTMLDFYSTKLNYDLPVLTLAYSPGSPRPSAQEACTVFFSLVLFPFFWLMGHMMVRRRSALGPFCLTGVLLVFPLSFSILPGEWALGALLMFWSALFLVSSVLQGREGLLGRKEYYKASGVAAARPGTLLILPLLLLCMLGIYYMNPPETYTRPRIVDQLRDFVEEGMGAGAYLPGGQGNSNQQVQLNKLGSRSYTGETVLRVRFDWAQDTPYYRDQTKEYLKSFTGSVYTGDSWERLPLAAREELSRLELVPQNQQAEYSREIHIHRLDSFTSYTLSVENLGANPRCVFTPCGLRNTPEELSAQGMEFVDDGFVKSSNFLTGTREYTLEGEGQVSGMNYFGRLMNQFTSETFGLAEQSGLMETIVYTRALPHSKYVSESALKFAERMGSYGTATVSLEEKENPMALLLSDLESQGQIPDLWTFSPQLRQELLSRDAPPESFFTKMEDYNRFVYQYYTQVPEELADFLERYREAFDLEPASSWNPKTRVRYQDGYIDLEDFSGKDDFRHRDGPVYFANRIAETFAKYYDYSLAPASSRNGQDFVEFFLDESHEGYCVHFASAAVLLLRSAGYPARYAEGYAVPCPDGLWADVPDYNAHAWVEVYCGGTGWVPVEVTPASTDNPASYYDAILPPEPEAHQPQAPEEEPMPTLSPRQHSPVEQDSQLSTASPRPSHTPGPEGASSPEGGGSGGNEHWPAVLAGAAVLAGIAGALWLNRSLRRSYWKKALTQPDCSAAALRAYALLLKLYGWEALCGRRSAQPVRWKELAEKARYSSHELSPEELGELVSAGEALKKKLRAQLPWPQKLRCWLSGLI